MELRIDHVAIAGRHLEQLSKAFSAAGFSVHYGGRHGSGATEMAIVVLDDGSYLELIAIADTASLDRNPFWSEQILADAGPCGWCVQVDDVEEELARLEGLGVVASGPWDGARSRPDGVEVRWRMAFPGEGSPGSLLPFLIEDVTPRELRVPPRSQIDSESFGRCERIAAVVVGVPALENAAAMLQHVYGWRKPTLHEEACWEARLAIFGDAPVVLAEPFAADSWLGERVALWGAAPCAYLLQTERPGAADGARWAGRDVAWIDPATLCGVRLGLVRRDGTGSAGSGGETRSVRP